METPECYTLGKLSIISTIHGRRTSATGQDDRGHIITYHPLWKCGFRWLVFRNIWNIGAGLRAWISARPSLPGHRKCKWPGTLPQPLQITLLSNTTYNAPLPATSANRKSRSQVQRYRVNEYPRVTDYRVDLLIKIHPVSMDLIRQF